MLITASGGALIPDVCSIILNWYAPPRLSLQVEWLHTLYNRLITPAFLPFFTDLSAAVNSYQHEPRKRPAEVTTNGAIARLNAMSAKSAADRGATNLDITMSWFVREVKWFRGTFENLSQHHPASAISPRQLYQLFQWARIEYGRQPTEDGARWSAPVNEPVWEAIRCGLAILLDTQQPFCWCSQCEEGGAAGMSDVRNGPETVVPIQFTQLWIQRVPPIGSYYRRGIPLRSSGVVYAQPTAEERRRSAFGFESEPELAFDSSSSSSDDEDTPTPTTPDRRERQTQPPPPTSSGGCDGSEWPLPVDTHPPSGKHDHRPHPPLDPVMIDDEEDGHLDDDGQLVYRIGWVCPRVDTTMYEFRF